MDFGDLVDKAKDLAGEGADKLEAAAAKAKELAADNAEKIEAAVDKVGGMVADKFGHGDRVSKVGDKLKGLIPDKD